MFGYVVPEKAELKVREYETFKAYYCGLCKTIGKKSAVSRLTLTYDMAFLGLLLSSLYEQQQKFEKKFCTFKMRNVMVAVSDPYIEYAAEMNTILSNRKLIDNYNDEKNYFSLLASKIIKIRKPSDKAGPKLDTIDGCLKNMAALERDKCGNIDEIGHYFGIITEEIFNVGGEKENPVLKVLGYNLGKWIYTLDAFDDLEEDIKKKRYNPFVYANNYKDENPEKFKKSIAEGTSFTLIKCLDEISKAFELLPIRRNRGIIENIIYMGMEQKTRSIIEGGHINEKSI